MGETRVDLLHLLEDLRDAYTGGVEDTILVEVVANCLDSKATLIRLATDPTAATLTILDDGEGMSRRELRRFHDIAASSKSRGAGIGFAGVGIKLGLLVAEHVVTETRRGKTHIATQWHLASRHRAPWRWLPPEGRVEGRGTAVSLKLQNPLSPLLDAGFLEATIRRHYLPLFDAAFDAVLLAQYPHGIRVEVNGTPLRKTGRDAADVAPIEVRLLRKRRPSAVGYVARGPAGVADLPRGIAISTLGKVIKDGWDWLGVTPRNPDMVAGVIEAPALAECLTLNKADFIRTGPRGATYLAYRKAVQEPVSRQLAAWGDARDPREAARERAARPVERDLERVLTDLADEFPLLTTLIERRADGQRRLPVGIPPSSPARALAATLVHTGADAGPPVGTSAIAATPAHAAESDALAPTSTHDSESGAARESTPDASAAPAATADAAAAHAPSDAGESSREPIPVPALAARGPRRPGRLGLSIQFAERPDDLELARLVESIVWVNTAHPAYRRAAASRSEGYHVALATALAVAPLAVETAHEHAFVTAFLARWGETLSMRAPRSRGRLRAMPGGEGRRAR